MSTSTKSQTPAQRAAAEERATTLAAITEVEAATDAHPTLHRPKDSVFFGDTRIISSRDYVKIEMSVRYGTDRRRKPAVIWADGVTLDVAVAKFIHDLDIWALVLSS